MDTFLITGAMGFVGSHLAEALLRRGKTVWGIDLAEPEYRDELLSYRNFHFVLDTIKNEEALVKLIDKADCVCHLAAIANPATYVENPHKVMDITMQMGVRVAELAQLREKLFFYTSTSEVYGRNPKVPWAESDDRILGATTINRWCYATAKAAVEHFILASHQRGYLDFLIVRLFNVYGPRLRGRVVYQFIQRALQGKPMLVHGDGNQTRCFTFIDDAIDAFIRLLETPATFNRIYNIGSTAEHSLKQLAQVVQKTADNHVDIVFEPHAASYGESYEDIPRRVPDVQRIKEAIGWEAATSLEEGVKRNYVYEKELYHRELQKGVLAL